MRKTTPILIGIFVICGALLAGTLVLLLQRPQTLPTVTYVSEQVPESERINVNTADEKQLQQITGIGPVLAGRIVAYREENGAFESLEELLEISGIGEEKLRQMEPYLKLTE